MTESNVEYGYIGNLVTGIIQTGSANEIYVTLESGMVIKVRNFKTSNDFQTAVKVGYDSTFLPGVLQVLGYWYKSETKNIDPHHTQHEWPNKDAVFVKGEQFYPCLFQPIDGTMQVQIFPGVYKTPTGWKNIKITTIVDLTSYIPSTTENACYVIVAMDLSGSFVVRKGDEVSGFANLTESHLPIPQVGDACVCGVMLFHGHTALRKDNNNNDFIDLRFSGASGGATNAPSVATLSILLNGLDAKTTLIDADSLPILDSAASNVLKKVTWASIKSALKTFFDSLYAALVHYHSGSDITNGTIDGDRLPQISTTKNGAVPATGTPSGKYLKDDGTWATPAGGSGGSSNGGVTVSDIVKVVNIISLGEMATSSASYSDVDATNLKVVFTKQQDSTDLVIDAAMSAYADGGANGFMIGINDGTADHDVASHYFNPSLTHMLASGSISLSGLNAGTYTFKLRWKKTSGGNTIHANADDAAYLKVTETGITAATSGGAGILGGQLVDCTSQVDGVTSHFTLPYATASVTVMVDGITQSPGDVTLDYDGLGFLLSWVPTTSDTNHLFAFCSVPLSTSISQEFASVVYTGGQVVHDLVDLSGLSITKKLENGVYYRWKFFFAGSKSDTGTLGVYITDESNNKLNNGVFSLQGGFGHSNFVEYVEMGTGATVTRKVRANVDSGTFSFASSSANFISFFSIEECGSREITVNVNPGSSLPGWISGSPNNPPAVSNSIDDEFDDAALNSKWSWVNQSGSTASFSNSCVLISAPPNTAIQITGIEQALPSGDAWTVRTKLSLLCQNENFVEVGILLRDSSTNKVFSFCLDGRGIGWKKWNAPNSWNSEISQIPVLGFPSAQFIYLQLVKTSPTSYDFYYSGNGISYFKFLSGIDVSGWVSPDKIGVYLNHCINNSLGSIFTVDWFRRIA